MTAPAARDPNEALAALERLYHKQVVTLEEAKAAARFITGDEKAEFPPPKPPAPPAAPVAAPPPPAEAEAPPAEGSANNGASG